MAEKILVVDVGGTHVKVLLSGSRTPRRFDSGPAMTPRKMVARIAEVCADWKYDKVSMGYPGLVLHGKIAAEPHNLGSGWLRFDFARAFGKPLRIINDAAMQALGDYRGGRMLFLGLGTGLGSAMIVDGVLAPMELGHLPYKNGKTYESFLGLEGLKRQGKKKWRKRVFEIVADLRAALEPDLVVLGGGNAKFLKKLPPGAVAGQNEKAFLGGVRLWKHASQSQSEKFK
jgi:polyphosphate glucokinase